MPLRPLALVLLFACGCCGPPLDKLDLEAMLRESVDDSVPVGVRTEALESVVLVRSTSDGYRATAVAIAPRLLLTANHVLENLDEAGEGRVEAFIAEQRTTLEVVERGGGLVDRDDWAILRLPPGSNCSHLAPIDPRLEDPAWSPPAGATVLHSGFAPSFRHAPPHRAPALPGAFRLGDRAGEWASEVGPYQLGGMSGGGVFLIDDESGKLTLIALHTGSTATARQFGWKILGWEVCLFRTRITMTVDHAICRIPVEALPTDERPDS